jgi:hypothetical protein
MAEAGIDYDPITGAPRFRQKPKFDARNFGYREATGADSKIVFPTASSTGLGINQDNGSSVVKGDELEEVVVTAKRNRRDPTRYSKSQMGLIKFPLSLEERGLPYILFKIFETTTGEVESAGGTAQQESLRAGKENITRDVSNAVGAGIDSVLGSADLAGRSIAPESTATVKKIAENGQQVASSAIGAAGSLLVGDNDIISTVQSSFRKFALNRNDDQLALGMALCMPENISVTYEHQYEDLELTNILGGLGLAAQAYASKDGSAATRDAFVTEAAALAASRIAPSTSELTNALLFSTTGKSINPQMEMFYKSPNLRTFILDFRLAPRNALEAESIKAIIKNLKYFSAPEIPEGTTGRYFIPPARFEIEFYHNDKPNEYLFKTKKCVLQNITLDYSPNGYASHSDGAPVETRMQLIFKETAIIDRLAAYEGY